MTRMVKVAFTSASYAETLHETVRGMGTANLGTQTAKVISWVFGVPVGEVLRDASECWMDDRRAEQNSKVALDEVYTQARRRR